MAIAVLLPGLGVLAAGAFIGPAIMEWRPLPLWSLLLFAVLTGIGTGFAVLPTHLVSLAAGYLYGFGGGSLAALTAVAIGTTLGIWIARRMARDRLHQLLERSPWGHRLTEEMLETDAWKVMGAILLARLPPQLPFALGNVIGASAGVAPLPFVAGTLLGMLPRVLLVVWVGASLSTWVPGAALPSGFLYAIALAVVGFGGLILWSARILKKRGATSDLPVEEA